MNLAQIFKNSEKVLFQVKIFINTIAFNKQMADVKAQVSVNLLVGLVIIMVGVLAISFMGLGFIFSNSTLIWVGSVVLGTIAVVSAILEKVLLP